MKIVFQKIGFKLLLVCLSFTLPIAVMLQLMVAAKQKDIDFAAWEKKGDQLQRPLEILLKQVSLHRILETRRFLGDTSSLAKIEDTRWQFEKGLKELRLAYQMVGEDLQFTQEGLGKRKRTEFTLDGLERKWTDGLAISGLRESEFKNFDAAQKGIIAHLRTMITHAGDTSNLILDPDLDSYYLMDVTLLALPQMEDRLQEIATFVEHLHHRGKVTRAESLQLGIMAQFLKEADLDRINGSVATAINEDQNFYGVSSSLQAKLPGANKNLTASIEPVVASVQQLAEMENIGQFDLAEFRKRIENAIEMSFDFHSLAIDEEDKLLDARSQSFQSSIQEAILWTTLALTFSAFLAFFIAANIIRRVKHFHSVTKTIAAGDLSARVNMTSADEIGELARSFDGMTEKIDRLNAQIAQKNNELTTVNADLERLVAERTRNMKTMLDNLDQGFFVFDKQGVIQPDVSSAATRFFGCELAGKRLVEVLPIDEDKKKSTTNWLEVAFQGALGFNSLIDLAPESFEFGGRYVELSYRPIYAEVSDKPLEKIICIASDKTDERALRQRAESEATLVRVVMRVLSDRPAFVDFVFETRSLFNKFFQELAQAEPSLEELFRCAHSIKGGLGIYCFDELSRILHDVETQLADLRGQPVEKLTAAIPSMVADLKKVVQQFEKFLETNEAVLGPTRETADRIKSFPVATIHKVCKLLEAEIGKESPLFHAYVDHFIQDDVAILFQRYESVVAGIADRQMKSVEFKLNTQGIKAFTDPYMPLINAYVHVFRNAVDHGIEDPEVRLAAGKPELGTVQVTMSQVRDQLGGEALRIVVADDGRGIDHNVIRKTAVEKKIVSKKEADAMVDSEVLQLLFRSGFSTASQVTDISGRGVGLDAVKFEIEKIGGTVYIETQPGRGTRVIAQVPHFKSVLGASGHQQSENSLRLVA